MNKPSSLYGKFSPFKARAAASVACFAFALAAVCASAVHRSHYERMRFIVLSHQQHDSGWVVDHKWPLCAGGCDCAENMQWQARPASLVKDRDEVKLCRRYISPEVYTSRWHVAPMVSPCPCVTSAPLPDAAFNF